MAINFYIAHAFIITLLQWRSVQRLKWNQENRLRLAVGWNSVLQRIPNSNPDNLTISQPTSTRSIMAVMFAYKITSQTQ